MDRASSSTAPMHVTLPRAHVAIATVMHLELMGRVRSKKWIISLIVWMAVIVLVWLGSIAVSTSVFGYSASDAIDDATRRNTAVWMLLFTLLVVLVVSPALSSTAVNAERQTSNLAIVQAAPISAAHLLWGKMLAGWITGAAFVLAAGIPLGIIAAVTGLSGILVVKSLAFILFEVCVVCALGLGFSSVVVRPVISVLITYLVAGALTVGGPLAFLFMIEPTTDRVEYTVRDWYYEEVGDPWVEKPSERYLGLNEIPGWVCEEGSNSDVVTHTDRIWWMIMTSPVAVMGDAVSGSTLGEHYAHTDTPRVRQNMFETISEGIALARVASPSVEEVESEILDVDPPRISLYDSCYIDSAGQIVPLEPSWGGDLSPLDYRNEDKWKAYLGHAWYWGAGFHGVLAVGALVTAWARLRIPVKRLAVGVRIA